MLPKQQLLIYLFRVPCILFAISFHESAHALVSSWLGDTTARDAGRVSLNPLRHLNPIGMLMMLIFGFGWASPVMINPSRFKNPKAGMALSAFAGPASNLLLGFVGAVLYAVVYYLCPVGNLTSSVLMFLSVFMSLNVSLAVFNMIPIPPLDGSRVLLFFLPERMYFNIMRYERYIMVVFIALMISGVISLPIGYASNAIINLFLRIASLPFGA